MKVYGICEGVKFKAFYCCRHVDALQKFDSEFCFLLFFSFLDWLNPESFNSAEAADDAVRHLTSIKVAVKSCLNIKNEENKLSKLNIVSVRYYT